MSVVRINAIDVPPERADEMARRFAARAGEVEKADGFEEFQLLRPTDDRTTWLVYTRWRDEAAFSTAPDGAGAPILGEEAGVGTPAGSTSTAWVESRAFGQGHAQHAKDGPVATGSELWAFRVEQREP